MHMTTNTHTDFALLFSITVMITYFSELYHMEKKISVVTAEVILAAFILTAMLRP